MQPLTLFITNREDVGIEYLIDKFRQRSDQYLRINSEDIGILEFEVNPSGSAQLTIEDTVYDLTNIKSVLFKRVPSKFNALPDDEDRPYLNNERKHFLEGLYLTFSNAKWINPMFATHIAERKLYQLYAAAKFGMITPASIITNKLASALQFLDNHSASIIKPISNGLQVLKERVYSIYTTEINVADFEKLEFQEVFETPVFLQEKIANSADIRVTIVHRDIFAVKITKQGEEVDWRKPSIEKRYSLTKLPPLLEKRLLELNNFFGMIYSAIDLILRPDGQYVFLEINPVGEWVWLEHELGIDISRKLIEALL